MRVEDMTPEQLERAKECGTAQELLDMLNNEGVDLTDDQLEQVVGGKGGWFDPYQCPKCSSTNVSIVAQNVLLCKDCDFYGSF